MIKQEGQEELRSLQHHHQSVSITIPITDNYDCGLASTGDKRRFPRIINKDKNISAEVTGTNNFLIAAIKKMNSGSALSRAL